MKAMSTKISLGAVIVLLSTNLIAAPQQNLQPSASPLNLVQHEIFSSLYYKQTQKAPKQEHKIKKLINNIKQMASFGLDDHIKLRVSRVKSGPLDKSITEMVKVAPGIQTHDGFVGDSSKGYGVKFAYEFN